MVVEGLKAPLIFLSTDVSLSAAQIIEIYGARFSIESALRVLKTDLGLGDYQVHHFSGHPALCPPCMHRLGPLPTPPAQRGHLRYGQPNHWSLPQGKPVEPFDLKTPLPTGCL